MFELNSYRVAHRLVFDTRLLLLFLLLPFAWSEAVAVNQAKPNVILISLDTLRADHLGCYGYKRVPTPNIDALSHGGTLFTQASSQVPLTTPSHSSLFTSTFPFANGVEDNTEPLSPHAVTLARVLKSAGYETAAFVGGFVMERRFGLNQGFDQYDDPFNLHLYQGVDPGDIKRPGKNVVAASQAWLKRHSGSPSFLFLHLYDLHTPYNVPSEARTRYRSGYDGELSYVDELVGRFTNYLKSEGLFEKSLIILLSDHGESLGEHDESTHGYFIYQSTIWVPLIIHWPNGKTVLPKRVDEPVGLIDVAPTILNALNVPSPPQFQGKSILGRSGGARSSKSNIYSESLYARNHFGTSALRSIRSGRYKYIEAPDPELYDLMDDPDEKQNIFATKQSVAQVLRLELRSLRANHLPANSATSSAISPEAVAALNSLGYITDGSAKAESSETAPDPKNRIADYETYGRALALAASGQLSESNRLLSKLLAKDQGLVAVHLSLGLNLQKQNQHRDAVEHFRSVLKKDPANVLAHFDMAVSYFQLGSLEEATKELKATLLIAPYYTRAEELLGTIALQRGDFATARRHFERILIISPDDYAAHYNLGGLSILEEKWEEGQRHLRAAIEIDGQSAEAHNTLGSLYLRTSDLDSARKEFQEAIDLKPNLAWAHYNLGLVLLREGNTDAAAQAFRHALEIDADFSAARKALERLGLERAH